MQINPAGRWKYYLLLVILAAGLALRLWGIRFGLPYSYHYDEHFYITGALNIGKGTVGEHPDPTGFTNILFAEYAAYFLSGRLAGLFQSLADFESAYRGDPSVFYLLGRLTSAILGSATVLMTYGLARKLINPLSGLISAALLAFSFLHVRDSHFAVTDVSVTSFVILAVFLSLTAVQKKSYRVLLLSAAAGGFALATKWTTWPVVVPIGLGLTSFFANEDARYSSRKAIRMAAFTAMVFLTIFLIGSFEFFMSPEIFWKDMLVELQSGSQGGFNIWEVDVLPGWLFYMKTLTWGTGWGILIFACIGIGLIIWRTIRNPELPVMIFLAFPLVYFLYMGASRHYFARYLIPLIPFVTISAAYTIDRIRNFLNERNRTFAHVTTYGLTIMLFLQPLVYSLRFDYLLTKIDTRTSAKQWIEKNIPENSVIAVDALILTPALAAPFRPVSESRPAYTVVEPGFIGLFTGGATSQAREKGYDYLIASSFIYNIPLLDREMQLQREKFYADLEQEFRLIKAFYPNQDQSEPRFIFDEMYGLAVSLWQRQYPGPVIKIYAVKQPEEP